MFEADLVFSCGEENFLPVVDVWIVIDVLRATTVMTRWFELGGTELYPVKTPDDARKLVLELRDRGSSPLLMGEINGLPPEGFDLGNSPTELNYDLIREHYCGVMSTTNGTVALNEAFMSGSPVIASSFRNYSACLDHALTLGNKIGFLCSGRKKRPSWEDTLCAGAILEKLNFAREVQMSDSAEIALTLWKSRDKDLEMFVKKSNHAKYLEKIGFDNDIKFACECNVSTVVPMLEKNNSHIILQSVSGSARPYRAATTLSFHEISPMKVESVKEEQEKNIDPFEELLSYTKFNSKKGES